MHLNSTKLNLTPTQSWKSFYSGQFSGGIFHQFFRDSYSASGRLRGLERPLTSLFDSPTKLSPHFSRFSTRSTYGRRFVTLFRALQLKSMTLNLIQMTLFLNFLKINWRHHVTYRRRPRPRVAVVAAAVACRAVARWGRRRRRFRSGPAASGRCRCRPHRRRPPNRNRCRRRPSPGPTAKDNNFIDVTWPYLKILNFKLIPLKLIQLK